MVIIFNLNIAIYKLLISVIILYYYNDYLDGF